MGARGPQSEIARLVPRPMALERVERPRAPECLTDDEAAEWTEIVNRMPAEWFPRETHGMLEQYCRHAVAARRTANIINALIERIEMVGDKFCEYLEAINTLDRLQKMQEREGRAMTSLATKMRITQQSTYDKSKKKPIIGKKPWD